MKQSGFRMVWKGSLQGSLLRLARLQQLRPERWHPLVPRASAHGLLHVLEQGDVLADTARGPSWRRSYARGSAGSTGQVALPGPAGGRDGPAAAPPGTWLVELRSGLGASAASASSRARLAAICMAPPAAPLAAEGVLACLAAGGGAPVAAVAAGSIMERRTSERLVCSCTSKLAKRFRSSLRDLVHGDALDSRATMPSCMVCCMGAACRPQPHSRPPMRFMGRTCPMSLKAWQGRSRSSGQGQGRRQARRPSRRQGHDDPSISPC